MKGLDTPVLLSLLHDSARARDLLKSLRGEELATTELNMFELEAIASEAAGASRGARSAALTRLRRRISVLPIGAESIREATRGLRGPSGYLAAVWGAMAAAGCGEWITSRVYAPPKNRFSFKVKIV